MADANTNISYIITALDKGAREAFEKIDEAVMNSAKDLEFAAGSVDDYRQKISILIATQNKLTIGSDEYKKLGISINDITAQYDKLIQKTSTSVQGLTKRTGNYNMVGINTARLFSDAGYAAQSFSFGVMSIGNNISPLVESLQRARSAGQGWKDILVSTFTGTSGWLVGINILVSAITAYSIATRGAKSATEEWDLKSLIGNINAYNDSLKKVKKEMSEISDIDLGKTFGELSKKLVEERFKMERAAQISSMGAGGNLWTMIFGKSEDYITEFSKITNVINIAIAEQEKRFGNVKSRNFLKRQLDQLIEDFDAGNTKLAPQILRLKNQIEAIDNLITPQKGKNYESYLKGRYGMLEPKIQFSDKDAADMYEKLKSAWKKMGLWDDTRESIALKIAFDYQENKGNELPRGMIKGAKAPDMIFYKTLDEQENAIKKMYKEEYFLATHLASSTGQAFKKMWADVFGTAEGFWNDFFTGILNDLTDLFMQGFAIDLFNWIANPIAALTGGIFTNTLSSGETNAPISQTINVNIGNKTVARVVSNGYKLATELRYMN